MVKISSEVSRLLDLDLSLDNGSKHVYQILNSNNML